MKLYFATYIDKHGLMQLFNIVINIIRFFSGGAVELTLPGRGGGGLVPPPDRFSATAQNAL